MVSKTVTRSIEGQFLSHTPINFASLTDSFVVLFSILLNFDLECSAQQTQNSFLGPKSYRDFRETGPRSEQRVWKWHCLVWKRVRIWRTRRHIPTKNFQEYPPPETNLYVVLHVNGENKIHWTGGNDFRYYNWRWWNPYVCVYSGYVHTIPDCFSFRHKKQSGKAMAQNWSKSLNASKIVPEQLLERVLVN